MNMLLLPITWCGKPRSILRNRHNLIYGIKYHFCNFPMNRILSISGRSIENHCQSISTMQAGDDSPLKSLTVWGVMNNINIMHIFWRKKWISKRLEEKELKAVRKWKREGERKVNERRREGEKEKDGRRKKVCFLFSDLGKIIK